MSSISNRAALILGALLAAGCVPPPAPPATSPEISKDSARVEPPIVPTVPVPPEAVLLMPDTVPTADTVTVRVCAGGDVMLGNNLDTTWVIKARKTLGRRTPAVPVPESLLAPLKPLVADADIVLLNVEGAIGTGPVKERKCGRRSRACYAFRQQPAVAAAFRTLSDSATIVGNIANNHARDAGPTGYEMTRRTLERAGVMVTGADSLPTIVVTASGDTVLFLGFGTNWPSVTDLDALRRWVSYAATIHPRVVVTMHLGAEGPGARNTRDSTEMFYGADRGNPVQFAQTAINAGARFVVGHGPHVMRAMEWRDSAFVAYSLGNLLTYGPFSMAEPNNRGGILCASVPRKGTPRNVVFHPTVQRPPGRVSVDPAGVAALHVDSLSRSDFPINGARVERENVGWRVVRP